MLTRKKFAKRCGISLGSIQAIETGVYKMNPEVAARISWATGVSPQSLLAGDNPLLDLAGEPFSKDSPRWEPLAWSVEHREACKHLFAAALDAAREKEVALQFSFLFETWLTQTIKALHLRTDFAEKLDERLLSLDPREIPDEFRPEAGRVVKRWEAFENEINKEFKQIFLEERRSEWEALGDAVIWPNPTASDKIVSRKYFELQRSCRAEARERVANRWRKAANEAESKLRSARSPRKPSRPRA